MSGEVKPREPFLLRNVPPSYYQDHQLAGVLQAIEAMLTSLCFGSYPQAFLSLYSGIEKLCKNVTGQNRHKKFHESFDSAITHDLTPKN